MELGKWVHRKLSFIWSSTSCCKTKFNWFFTARNAFLSRLLNKDPIRPKIIVAADNANLGRNKHKSIVILSATPNPVNPDGTKVTTRNIADNKAYAAYLIWLRSTLSKERSFTYKMKFLDLYYQKPLCILFFFLKIYCSIYLNFYPPHLLLKY